VGGGCAQLTEFPGGGWRVAGACRAAFIVRVDAEGAARRGDVADAPLAHPQSAPTTAQSLNSATIITPLLSAHAQKFSALIAPAQ
jgi:hypothetical protein